MVSGRYLLAAALLVTTLFSAPTSCAAQGNRTAVALSRTFPYGDGSLSADGRYVCFTSSALAYSHTVCYTPSQDTSGICYGSIGSYYCGTQFSYSSSPSLSISYNNMQGRCYESPGAAYADTPCLWRQIRMDYSQTGACAGTYSGLYVYYWYAVRSRGCNTLRAA